MIVVFPDHTHLLFMGGGVYVGSGLCLVVSRIYVVHCVLYGLEMLSCTQFDIQALERLQGGIMRKVQSLPSNTATVIVTCLLGVRPLNS